MAGSDNPYQELTEGNPYQALVDGPQAQIRTGVLTSQDDPGALGSFMLAAGRRTDHLKEGAKHLGLNILRRFYEAQGNTSGARRLDQRMREIGEGIQDRDETFSPVQETHPLATTLGDSAPYATPIGGIGGAAALGGGLGFLDYSPTMGGRLLNAGKMGALNAGGAAVGGALSYAAAPGQNVMNRGLLTSPMTGPGGVLDRMRGFKAPDASGEILSNMERRGLTPRVSEIGGSQTARQAEDYLSRAPGSSGVMSDFAARNRSAVNTAAAGSIGERARNLSADVLSDADTRIGGAFNAVAALPGQPVAVLPTVGAAAAEVLRKHSLRPLSPDPLLEKVATTLQALSQNKGRLTGEAYNALRSDLSAAANRAYAAKQGPIGALYTDLLDALDSSAATSLQAAGHGEIAGNLVKARGQYNNLMSLERGNTVTAGGDVNPQALDATMRQKFGKAYKEGGLQGNPLYDIARYGGAYKPLVPGSQTFERGAIKDIAEVPGEMIAGTGERGPSMVGLATAPFNWLGAQYMTSPLARLLSRRGILGFPTLSHGGGVLSDVVARDLAAGLPGSLGVLNQDNWE